MPALRQFQFLRVKLFAPETKPLRHLNRVYISIAERDGHRTDQLRSEWCRDSLIGKRKSFIKSNT